MILFIGKKSRLKSSFHFQTFKNKLQFQDKNSFFFEKKVKKMSFNLDKCKGKVLRKLGITESIYDNEVLNNNFLLTVTILTTLDEPYFVDKNLIDQASSEWTQRHKLLRATIVRQSHIYDKSARYFVEIHENINNNIEFTNLNDVLNLKDLIETEVKTSFHKSLWRMKILKLMNATDYVLLFTIHHGLSDGKNAYALLMEFIGILQALLLRQSILHVNEFCEFSLEDLVFKLKHEDSLKTINDSELLKNSLKNRTIMPKHVKCETFNGICSSSSHGKFDYFVLDSIRLDKLIFQMKCKAPKSKLTSVLACILCLAFKNTFKKHVEHEWDEASIQFYLMIE